MANICKKCGIGMNITSLKVKRRGNKTKNIPTEYYCPKYEQMKYDHDSILKCLNQY